MPTAVSLTTKGVISQQFILPETGGGPSMSFKQEELPKPFIQVTNVELSKEKQKFNEENISVTSVKMLVD